MEVTYYPLPPSSITGHEEEHDAAKSTTLCATEAT